MNKRPLQIATAVLACVPVLTGLIGLMGLSDPLYASQQFPPSPMLDSNLRFFSGVWLGLGVAVIWLIPRIAEQTVLYRVLWCMIFLGGVGRLMSLLLAGLPPVPFVGFTALEIIGAPIFIVWQTRVAQSSPSTR